MFEDIVSKIIVAVVSAVLTGVIMGVINYYKNKPKAMLDETVEKAKDQSNEYTEQRVQEVVGEIEKLRKYVRDHEIEAKRQMDLIIDSYKYRLTQLCHLYLGKGFMTYDEYEQLTQMYTLYTELGGNGQAKLEYERVSQLEIREK